MDHYAALLAMAPESTSTEEKLRQLAERGGHHERYADGVATAARAARPIRRAGSSCSPRPRARGSSACSDIDGAIKLLVEASAVSGAAEHEQLVVARRLAGAVRADQSAEGAPRACSSARRTSRRTTPRAPRS